MVFQKSIKQKTHCHVEVAYQIDLLWGTTHKNDAPNVAKSTEFLTAFKMKNLSTRILKYPLKFLI